MIPHPCIVAQVMSQLHRPQQLLADGGLRLLYVTPERFKHSTSFTSALSKLYNANALNRFVIDEVKPRRGDNKAAENKTPPPNARNPPTADHRVKG